MRWLALILLFVGHLATAQVTVPGLAGDCGFSKFHPLRISHYVEKGVVEKVTPQYPPAARANKVVGSVRVRVLINRRGLVEGTCPEYVKNQPRPDRSLVTAAEAAALQWLFSPNFGLKPEPTSDFKMSHVQGVLVFDFVLDDRSQAGSKRD